MRRPPTRNQGSMECVDILYLSTCRATSPVNCVLRNAVLVRACSARNASGLASYTRRRCERGFMATPPYSNVLHGNALARAPC